MSTVTRRHTNPLSELRQWLESDLGLSLRGGDSPSFIRIEDYIDGETYVLRAELPGIDPDKDVDITVDDGLLTIRAERSEEKRDRDHRELHYGSFSRTVSLPRGSKVDDVEARYRDGVLEVRLPVEESAATPQRVPVARATD